MHSRILILSVFFLAPVFSLPAPGQAPPPPPTPMRASPLTLPQILARQKANYDNIQTAQGQVVWTVERGNNQQTTPSGPERRIIHFALEPQRSVTLVLPASESTRYVENQGRLDWSKVLSAAAIDGDLVYSISQPAGASAPEVHPLPNTPELHEANPLIAFHPRQLGEEPIKQSTLAEQSPPATPARPRVTEVIHQARQAVRVDVTNPAQPSESLYYILDPARAYLPMEIGRMEGGQLTSRSTIVLGHTKDRTWIPARREKLTFDQAGQITSRENWHYLYLSVNEALSRRGTSLSFFHLPGKTRYFDPAGKPLPTPAAR